MASLQAAVNIANNISSAVFTEDSADGDAVEATDQGLPRDVEKKPSYFRRK